MYTSPSSPKLVTRGDNLPVKLVGTNSGLLDQVLKNRTTRRYMPNAHTIMLIECEVAETVMLLDSDAILCQFFAPVTPTEKWAIRVAEKIVAGLTGYILSGNSGVVSSIHWVDELLWMVYTGNMKNDMDRTNFADAMMYEYWSPPSPVYGTWNLYEREL